MGSNSKHFEDFILISDLKKYIQILLLDFRKYLRLLAAHLSKLYVIWLCLQSKLLRNQKISANNHSYLWIFEISDRHIPKINKCNLFTLHRKILICMPNKFGHSRDNWNKFRWMIGTHNNRKKSKFWRLPAKQHCQFSPFGPFSWWIGWICSAVKLVAPKQPPRFWFFQLSWVPIIHLSLIPLRPMPPII